MGAELDPQTERRAAQRGALEARMTGLQADLDQHLRECREAWEKMEKSVTDMRITIAWAIGASSGVAFVIGTAWAVFAVLHK